MIDVALSNVFRQKIRSFLTTLGIAIGIGLILSLGAIGEGLNHQIEQQFGDIAGVIDVSYTGDDDEGIEDDLIEEITGIQGVASVVPITEYRISQAMRGGGGFMSMRGGFGGMLSFTGVYPEDLKYMVGENIIAEDGRKIEESDSGDYVVLLGASLAESQDLNVGDEIEYERSEDDDESTESFYFEVVGVLEETGDSEVDDVAFVPLETMQELEDDYSIERLKVKLSDVDLVEQVTDELNEYSDDLRAFSPLEVVRSLQETLGTLQMAVYGIGAISILVGGIGIINTMIMSVMERKREIGIMKAIGATTTNILVQVLEESAFLSLIGGTIGLALGYGACSLITKYTSFNTIITMELVAIAVVFSLILGIGAGLYPAWSASRLDPIEVLRYE
ncbi:MAG: hypothetical protein B6U97_04475 [Candidatus Altiarchaeales archaeon ex4484_96]|nr:MAG: hypothetical protein B6U97_04475 [Candidatus Altiarchaeales archaeon ex4484_96]